jgi:hypothetical protein
MSVHPGLIVLRESGLSRDEQWRRIHPEVEYVKNSGNKDFLLNKLIEIAGTRRFETREIPPPDGSAITDTETAVGTETA